MALPIALALLFVAAAGLGSPVVTFPGLQRDLSSPDSAFTILWSEPDASNTGHSLLLKAAHSPKTWRVHAFHRSVSVSWAPRSHVFVVTDRLGSDSATTFAQNAATGSSVDVCAGPQRDLGARWLGAHHRYCEQAGWTDRGRLLLRLWGYGEGVSFDTQVTVTLPKD
jgi:hypothetical protein